MELMVSFDKFFNAANSLDMVTTSSMTSLSSALCLYNSSTNAFNIKVLLATFSANYFEVPVMLCTKQQIAWNILRSRKSEIIKFCNS